ncbi:hypothetical protein F4775DRAFT_543337 [Biscogniauxia sp. FL1348]|nr:hypothetical protein F4775DRAFT_543337 [Biscogniauxia sp. FL1348]
MSYSTIPYQLPNILYTLLTGTLIHVLHGAPYVGRYYANPLAASTIQLIIMPWLVACPIVHVFPTSALHYLCMYYYLRLVGT